MHSLVQLTELSASDHPSSPVLLALLPRRGSRNTSSNNARQLLCSHAIHHPDNTHNEHRHRDAKHSEESELGADIFLLASCASPQVRLLASVLVGADDGAAAFALEAGSA